MSLAPEDVQRIAHLARLQLSEAELAAYSVQLQAIVAFVDQLQAVDTTGVEPMVHAIELSNVLAADEVRVGLSRDAALSNSPDHDDECFRVPAVLG
jgi:aspartyl-tRNA(Asn)/glutamyl-tRNA(Gln) amidotransferase subunit C